MKRRTVLSLSALGPVGVLALPSMALAEPRDDLSRGDVVRWIEAYADAWETRDADAAAQLFTNDAEYAALPGVPDQTYIGRSAIHAYWASITAGQSDITVLHGEPVVHRMRAMVELWVTMRVPFLNPNGDNMVTLIETNVLSFANRREVERNLEYWNIMMGVVAPPPRWGMA